MRTERLSKPTMKISNQNSRTEQNRKMTDRNTSIVLHGKDNIKIENSSFPESMKQMDAVLKTNFGGISATDIQLWLTGGLGSIPITEPTILGYEISATVIQVGSKVENLKIGDRVAIEPFLPCHDCKSCLTGFYNLCEKLIQGYHGPKPTSGYFKEYFIHPAPYCHKLTTRMTSEEGVFVTSLASVVHAIKRAGVEMGMRVLVIGTGGTAMLLTLTLRAMGITELLVVGFSEEKLAGIRELGTFQTVLIKPTDGIDTSVKAIKESLTSEGTSGPHVIFDCLSNDHSLSVCIEVAVRGGKVVPFLMPHDSVSIPATKASLKEIDIIGASRSRHSYKLAIYLLHSGRVNVKQLITHRYRLKDAMEAFKAVKERQGTKVLIEF